MMEKSPENMEQKVQRLLTRIQADTHELAEYVQILKGQVQNAEKESEAEVVKIITSFEHIQNESKFLLDTLNKQKDKAASIIWEEKEVLKTTNKLLGDLESYRSIREQQVIEEIKAIKRQERDINELFKLFAFINDINEQTHLLAINTAVVAARAGSQGRVFAVVAKELQTLSLKIAEATKKIDQKFLVIAKTIEEFLLPIIDKTRIDMERKELVMLQQGLESASHTFTELSKYFIVATEASYKAMQKMQSDIVEALGHIQFQDVLRQQLEHVVMGLEDLNRYFELVTQKTTMYEDDEWFVLKEKIQELRNQYVMQQQQTVHDSVLGNNMQADNLFKEELF